MGLRSVTEGIRLYILDNATSSTSHSSSSNTSYPTNMSRRIAVIIGAGPGLWASLAQSLSKTHSLLLLSRSLPESLPKLNLKISQDQLIAASSDGSRSSLDAALAKVKEKWPEGIVDVGIFNTGGKYNIGPFLEGKVEDLQENLMSGGYVFASNNSHPSSLFMSHDCYSKVAI